eukprot:7617884-Pyramimonas_sp.AAC.1
MNACEEISDGERRGPADPHELRCVQAVHRATHRRVHEAVRLAPNVLPIRGQAHLHDQPGGGVRVGGHDTVGEQNRGAELRAGGG